MQVHLSSRGWSAWPQWSSLLDSTALSFPSTSAHTDLFDLVATSSSRVQMQHTKLPELNSLCKIWCFSSWLSLNVPWELLSCCHLLGQPVGSVELGKDFCPERLCVAHCFNHQHVLALTVGQNMPRPLQKANHFLQRKQFLQLASVTQVLGGVVVLWKTPGYKEMFGLIQTCLG